MLKFLVKLDKIPVGWYSKNLWVVVFPDSYNPEKDVEFYNSIEKNKKSVLTI